MGLRAGVASLWGPLGWYGSACTPVFPPSGQQQAALRFSSLKRQVSSYNVVKFMLKSHPGVHRGIKEGENK